MTDICRAYKSIKSISFGRTAAELGSGARISQSSLIQELEGGGVFHPQAGRKKTHRRYPPSMR